MIGPTHKTATTARTDRHRIGPEISTSRIRTSMVSKPSRTSRTSKTMAEALGEAVEADEVEALPHRVPLLALLASQVGRTDLNRPRRPTCHHHLLPNLRIVQVPLQTPYRQRPLRLRHRSHRLRHARHNPRTQKNAPVTAST